MHLFRSLWFALTLAAVLAGAAPRESGLPFAGIFSAYCSNNGSPVSCDSEDIVVNQAGQPSTPKQSALATSAIAAANRSTNAGCSELGSLPHQQITGPKHHFIDKFHSLHTYGLAVQSKALGVPGAPIPVMSHEIAARHGVICPYGPRPKFVTKLGELTGPVMRPNRVAR
jgi:hypothetical protein